MKSGIIISILVLFLYSCNTQSIVQEKDYKAYLAPHYVRKAAANTNQEIAFWQSRLAMDPDSFVDLLELGFHHLGLFQLKGNIKDLKTGDSLLKQSAGRLNNSDPAILQALSQAAITQHQFKEADAYNRQAYEKE